MQCLTLVHTVACVVGSAIAQAVVFLNRVWLVSHRLSNGWLLSLDIVVMLAAIHSVNVIRHSLRGCVLSTVNVRSFRRVT